MKKTLCMVLIIAALLSLAACGECSHENWLEASCVEPARCADCGFTEGEALAHSAADASCSEAGLCTLCGELVAEPLPHSFGLWEIHGEEMSRRCSGCGTEESAPTDRELYFAQLISGHWDYYLDPENRSAFWAYAGNGGPEFWPTARFDEQSGGMLTLPITDKPEQLSSYSYDWDAKEIKDHELRWEYQGFEANSLGEDCYSFGLSLPDGSRWPGLLRVTEYELLIELKPEGADTMTLFKSLYHEQTLSGYWWHLGSSNSPYFEMSETDFYFLELRPDRTFFCNLFGEEISGSWHAKPIMDSIGLGYSKPMAGDGVFQTYVALWYEKDGELRSYVQGIALPIGGAEDPLSEETINFGGLLYADWDDVDERGKEALTALPGTWRSETFMESHRDENGEKTSESTVETDEFYIDFTEDYHFKAHIDKDYEGRYFLYSVAENSYSSEDFAYITIYLMPEEPEPGKEIIRGEMYYYPDSGLSDAFQVYMKDNYESGKLKYSGIYFFGKT